MFFQHIALLSAVCVTLHHTTHRVGCLFTTDGRQESVLVRASVLVAASEAGGCLCRVWERHPIVDHAVDTVEPMKHKKDM